MYLRMILLTLNCYATVTNESLGRITLVENKFPLSAHLTFLNSQFINAEWTCEKHRFYDGGYILNEMLFFMFHK